RRTPAPITTFGNTIVRAPIDTPAPIVANGPIETSGPIAASAATLLKRSIPLAGGVVWTSSATACANARYGFSARSTAHDRGALASPAFEDARITADARVWPRSA